MPNNRRKNKKNLNNNNSKQDKEIEKLDSNTENHINSTLNIYSSVGKNLVPDWMKNLSGISTMNTFLGNPLLSTINQTPSWYEPFKSVTTLTNYAQSNLGSVFNTIDPYAKNLNYPIYMGGEKNYSTTNDRELFEKILPLNDNSTNGEIIELKKKLKDAISKYNDQVNKNESLAESETDIRKLYDQLVDKESKAHIISRVHTEYYKQIVNSDVFFKEFENSTGEDIVVISIDIRRSTDLMLKASTPEKFVQFITELTKKLSECVKRNFGIFDKFTGDGILAFFPNFYSDKYAILYAIRTAMECHDIFFKHYNLHQDSFDVFIEDVGLGIGIEYGKVAIVTTDKELTIVGKPVVYACRYSGAKAGDTLLGVKAIQQITPDFINFVDFEQTSIFIKNEGNARVYKIIKSKPFEYLPNWTKFQKISLEETQVTEKTEEVKVNENNNESTIDKN